MASIEGAISDIELVNRTNDGVTITSAVFKLETQNPSSYWDVKISPEQVKAGIVEVLKKYETPKDSWSKKPVILNIGNKESFFNNQKFFSFFLDSIPSQNGSK